MLAGGGGGAAAALQSVFCSPNKRLKQRTCTASHVYNALRLPLC